MGEFMFTCRGQRTALGLRSLLPLLEQRFLLPAEIPASWPVSIRQFYESTYLGRGMQGFQIQAIMSSLG